MKYPFTMFSDGYLSKEFILLKRLLLIGLIVIAVGIAVSAQESVTYLEGDLSVTHIDPAPGSGGQYQMLTMLIDDAGSTTQLEIPAKMIPEQGGRVRVFGTFVESPQSGSSVFAVSQVEALSSPLETPQTTGTLNYLTLLCRFSDSTDYTPYPTTYFDGLMGNTYPGVQHFWSEVSEGQLTVVSTTVSQWVNMTKPLSGYSYVGQASLDSHWDMAQNCADMTAQTLGINYSNYDGLTLIFNQPYTNVAIGKDAHEMTLNGVTRTIRASWHPPFSYENVYIASHEVGHTFGIMHSGGKPGHSRYPYDSYWDVMSGGSSDNPLHASYGVVPAGTVAYHKDKMGWIPSSRRVEVSPGQAQTVQLEQLHQPVSTTNPLMVKIPISGSTDFYTVEARFNGEYEDGTPGIEEVVLIYKTHDNLDSPVYVVDSDGNIDANDAGAMWTAGETFTDSATGISVQVISKGTSSFQVCVSNNGGACGSNPNPTPTATTPPGTGVVANDDNYTTPMNTPLNISASQGVMANDTGNKYGAYIAQSTTSGSVYLHTDGSFTYTPRTGFQGTDIFIYQVHDGSTMSNTATVTIMVGSSETPTPGATPVANDDSYSTSADQKLSVSIADGILKNDTGNSLIVTSLMSRVSNGTLYLYADGSFTYTPNTGFVGTDSFSYQAHDGYQHTNTATVTIAVSDPGTGGGTGGGTGTTPQAPPQMLEVLGSLDMAPIKPSFQWQHETQAGQTTVPGAYYHLVVKQGTTMIFDEWFEASTICTGTTCTVPYLETALGVFGKTMPSTGLLAGDHSFYVESYIDNDTPIERSQMKTFTVSAAPPQLPANFSVDNNISPAQFVWTDDASALYYYVYIGDGINAPLFFDWVEKTTSLCDGLTCRFTPPTAVQPGVYLFFIQSWGPGGLTSGGFQNLGWDGAQVTVGPGLATNMSSSLAGNTATLSFTAASDADSYRLWVGTLKGGIANEAYFQTHTAADLGCTTAGSTCTFTLDISSFAPDTYNWYVQASGPIGISAAGNLFGWATGIPFFVN